MKRRRKRTSGDSPFGCLDGASYLSAEEEARLAGLAQAGDIAARNKLVESQLRYAARVAKCYIRAGVDYDDLFQIAVQALMKAVERFNPSIARFNTYATFWIRERLNRALHRERIVHVPRALPLGQAPKCVALSFLETDEQSKQEQLRQSYRVDYCERLHHQNEVAELHQSLKRLELRDRVIVMRRAKGDLMEDIGRDLGLTRQRIQQLEERALRRLREIHLRRRRMPA